MMATLMRTCSDHAGKVPAECPLCTIAALKAGYAEAIEDIDSWAAYAGGYFHEKHDLQGCLEQHRAVLAGEPGVKR